MIETDVSRAVTSAALMERILHDREVSWSIVHAGSCAPASVEVTDDSIILTADLVYDGGSLDDPLVLLGDGAIVWVKDAASPHMDPGDDYAVSLCFTVMKAPVG